MVQAAAPHAAEPAELFLNVTDPFCLITVGVQGAEHPRPGVSYSGTQRVAYFPDSDAGKEVLGLLELAWERRLLFTVGDSVTTGAKDVVTFNGVHFKTSRTGGASNHGYPDAQYLSRILLELANKGVVAAGGV